MSCYVMLCHTVNYLAGTLLTLVWTLNQGSISIVCVTCRELNFPSLGLLPPVSLGSNKKFPAPQVLTIKPPISPMFFSGRSIVSLGRGASCGQRVESKLDCQDGPRASSGANSGKTREKVHQLFVESFCDAALFHTISI